MPSPPENARSRSYVVRIDVDGDPENLVAQDICDLIESHYAVTATCCFDCHGTGWAGDAEDTYRCACRGTTTPEEGHMSTTEEDSTVRTIEHLVEDSTGDSLMAAADLWGIQISVSNFVASIGFDPDNTEEDAQNPDGSDPRYPAELVHALRVVASFQVPAEPFERAARSDFQAGKAAAYNETARSGAQV